MIIINYEGIFDPVKENKLIQTTNNDYVSLIEYVNNEFDDVLIKEISSINEHWIDLKDKFHNPIGPAMIIYYDDGPIGKKFYYNHGKYHRLDGPAYQFFDKNGELNSEEYWVNGIEYSKKQFRRAVKKYKNDHSRL